MSKPVQLLGKIPTRIRLRLDGEKVLARASTGAASAIRSRWDAGMGAQGSMPEARDKDAREPMDRTGFMKSKIKGYWGSKRSKRNRDGSRIRWVGPKGTYPGTSKRAAMVYYVNVHTRPNLKESLPLGWDDRVAEKASKFAGRDVARQLKTRNAGLAMELRKLR